MTQRAEKKAIELKLDSPCGDCELTPVLSKSDSIRSAVLSYILDIPFRCQREASDDVVVTISALSYLQSSSSRLKIDLGLGGAPFRFTLALAAVTPGKKIEIDVEPPLRSRPHQPLYNSLAALENFGLKADYSSWPIRLDSTALSLPEALEFEVEASSSQYISAISFAGAYVIRNRLSRSVRLFLKDEIRSEGYLRMTLDWLRSAGFDISFSPELIELTAFRPEEFIKPIPYDWSSTAYLLAWSWLTGCEVLCSNPEAHPDGIVVEILEKAGLQVAIRDGKVKVSGKLTDGLQADANVCPDLVPTLAMFALMAPKSSAFRNVSVLRSKESDRLEFIMDIVEKAGGQATLESDKLLIFPTDKLPSSISISTEDDHRRAMAGSLLAAFGVKRVNIEDGNCVSKSFPSYWKEISKCGATWRTIDGLS